MLDCIISFELRKPSFPLQLQLQWNRNFHFYTSLSCGCHG